MFVFRPRKRRRRRLGKKGASFALMWALFFLCLFLYDHYFGLDYGGADEWAHHASTAGAEPLPSSNYEQTGRLRVCTFNLRNYLPTDRAVGGVWRRNYPKPEGEKRELAKILAEINPDLLLLQEMGDENYLLEFMRLLAARGLVYRYYALSGGADHERHLALLSKIRPEAVYRAGDVYFDFDGRQTRSPRGLLMAKFSRGKFEWFAGTIHLKSKYGAKKADDEFSPYRKAELAAILSYANRRARDEAALLGGDFNDEPAEPHIAEVLRAASFSYVLQADKRGREHSYYWNKGKAFYVYDFFIANRAMLSASGAIGPKVYGIPRSASDHSPVYADLDFSKVPKN